VDVGFIGLGNMGFQMARRLVDADHHVVVFDSRREVVDELVALGAHAGSSVRDVADQVETVMASLPSVQASLDVAMGSGGVIAGARVTRFVELSTVGAPTSVLIAEQLAEHDIAHVDCPVSGGVGGARRGALALMVSGPEAHAQAVRPLLDVLGTVFFIGEQPGAGQTMKLANNLLAATSLAATSEAIVLGVKAGLDPAVMIDVFNAGSGATHASRDKFPKSVLTRTFDYGFATGLMVKDIRLCLEQVESLGLSMEIAQAVSRVWEATAAELGPGSDFTAVIKPMEDAAGVMVGGG
jgi:3-hydroxyisobutyrate dehydrogenase-like beta-hydroxyacid dehydrogenase